jgi:hypothetical protein
MDIERHSVQLIFGRSGCRMLPTAITGCEEIIIFIACKT